MFVWGVGFVIWGSKTWFPFQIYQKYIKSTFISWNTAGILLSWIVLCSTCLWAHQLGVALVYKDQDPTKPVRCTFLPILPVQSSPQHSFSNSFTATHKKSEINANLPAVFVRKWVTQYRVNVNTHSEYFFSIKYTFA